MLMHSLCKSPMPFCKMEIIGLKTELRLVTKHNGILFAISNRFGITPLNQTVRCRKVTGSHANSSERKTDAIETICCNTLDQIILSILSCKTAIHNDNPCVLNLLEFSRIHNADYNFFLSLLTHCIPGSQKNILLRRTL